MILQSHEGPVLNRSSLPHAYCRGQVSVVAFFVCRHGVFASQQMLAEMLSCMVMIFLGETMFEMGSNAGKPLIVTIQHFHTENKMPRARELRLQRIKRGLID